MRGWADNSWQVLLNSGSHPKIKEDITGEGKVRQVTVDIGSWMSCNSYKNFIDKLQVSYYNNRVLAFV